MLIHHSICSLGLINDFIQRLQGVFVQDHIRRKMLFLFIGYRTLSLTDAVLSRANIWSSC